MKYLSSFALVMTLVGVTGCANTDSPSAPSGNSSQTYTATLRPSEEVPAVAGAESAGTGTATITLNVSRDTYGNVTSATAAFAVNLNGFPAGTPINMAHIHQAAAGQSGNVVVSTTLAAGEVVLNGGSGSFNRSGVAVTPDVASQLMSHPASVYFNV